MKNYCLLLLITFFSVTKVCAQYDAILNDPDVIWAAEIDLTFWIEPAKATQETAFFTENFSTVLKVLNRNSSPSEISERPFSKRIIGLLHNIKHPVFAHPDSLRALSIAERNHILTLSDTFTVTDPVTGMEENKVVLNEPGDEYVQQIKVRQLLFYRDKTDEFEVYTQAFAPYLKRYIGSDVSSDRYYLFIPFWFKMPPYMRGENRKSPSLDDPNITWASRIRTGSNMPHLDSLRPFKDFRQPIMQQYLNRISADPDFEVKEGLNWSIMTKDQRDQELLKTDTIVTFDAETYEEKVVVVQDELTGQEVMQLRLLEDWFWNERLGYPIFRLYAFAPMKDQKDAFGNFRYKLPIFWHTVSSINGEY